VLGSKLCIKNLYILKSDVNKSSKVTLLASDDNSFVANNSKSLPPTKLASILFKVPASLIINSSVSAGALVNAVVFLYRAFILLN
jgi:hypothetical protein